MGANELTGSAIAAYICAEVIQWVKCHPATKILAIDTKKWNRIVTALIALVVSLGIHAGFDAQTGTLTVTGLFAGSIMSHLGEWIRQWAFQQILYRTAIQPNVKEDGTL